MSDNWTPHGDNWNTPNQSLDMGATNNGDNWTAGTTDHADEFQGGVDSSTTGDFGAATGQDGCRNCGQEGHFARECPEPRKLGPCFNCNEEGHSKAECLKPRVFKGTCNICNVEGHPAARCPEKPKICGRCKEEGHLAKDCDNNYPLGLDDVPTITEDAAWAKVVDASLNKDMDDFKDALRTLQKAAPELTYPAIEKKLRAQDLSFYLIALKKECGDGHTYVNLQGEPEKKHCVAIFKSPNCQRPILFPIWPKDADENLARLADAGIIWERGISYCRVCSSYGHAARDCDQEKVVLEGPQIQCALCGELGHRVRDCKTPRQKPREKRTCKICGSEDHLAKECDQRQVMKCRNCEQEGHKASECTEPRVLRCNNPNCNDPIGHLMKDCPTPIAWEKLTCRHCGETGHVSANRCAVGTMGQENGNAGGNENTLQGEVDKLDKDQMMTNLAKIPDWENGVSVAQVMGANAW